MIPASFRRLYALLTPRDRRNAGILFAMMLVGAVLEVLGVASVPVFVGALVSEDLLRDYPTAAAALDALGLDTTVELVLWGAGALIAIYGLKCAFLLVNHYGQVRYATRRRADLVRRLIRAYLSAPYAMHLKRNSSELIRNIDREASIIAYQLIGTVLDFCTQLLVLVAVFGLLFVVEPVVTLYWIAFFGAIGIVAVLLAAKRLRRYGQRDQKARAAFVQILYEAFGGIKEAMVLNREGYFADRVDEVNRTIAEVHLYKHLFSRSIMPVSEFVAVVGMLILTAALVLSGRSTESVLITLSLFGVGLVRLRQTVSGAMLYWTNLRYNLVSVDPVFEDLSLLEGKGRDIFSAPPQPINLKDEVALQDIWHRYPGAKEFALQDINVTIPKGGAIAFVGSTGAGKSTLIDVLMGLLQPERGGVFADGTDVRELGLARWRARVGYVPQAIYLLDDTIRRNIAFGVPDEAIDEGALGQAIEAAQLGAFLARQSDGVATIIGERGARLSGGERQRIGSPARSTTIRRSSSSTRRRPPSTTPPNARSSARSTSCAASGRSS
ncbi:ABC transporter transmembrane domain-containing protein [Acuticoccus sp.]|uniref:ABC transporter transmembrane domain-containing protein n=1 Tax=Acuticoccus sp. TaxID=1904378 RepID=UPI003B52D500